MPEIKRVLKRIGALKTRFCCRKNEEQKSVTEM